VRHQPRGLCQWRGGGDALAEALAQTTEAATAEQTTEEADRRAALRAVEAFQAREAVRAQRMVEAARVQPLEKTLGVSSGKSSAKHDLPGRRLF
jgi:hypothetical protein